MSAKKDKIDREAPFTEWSGVKLYRDTQDGVTTFAGATVAGNGKAVVMIQADGLEARPLAYEDDTSAICGIAVVLTGAAAYGLADALERAAARLRAEATTKATAKS